MVNHLTVIVFAGMLVGSLALQAGLLWIVSRWLGATKSTLGRAVAIAVAAVGYQFIFLALYELLSPALFAQAGLVAQLLAIPLLWLVIVKVFDLSWPKAILTSVISYGLAFAVWFAVIKLAIQPTLLEAFSAPTIAMAPTILGPHVTAACPRCGAPAYASPHALVHSGYERDNDSSIELICSHDLKTCRVNTVSPVVEPGDRFVVNKLLTPQRWDVVVFRFPAEPSVNYIKRLVGLPGEVVVIRDGSVWIDGQRAELPPELHGLEYVNQLDGGPNERLSGSPGRPAILGPDEYFMLGDFSALSSDSRVWSVGAPGHPPYAVPKSNLIGVVTHIYWPLARARSFQ